MSNPLDRRSIGLRTVQEAVDLEKQWLVSMTNETRKILVVTTWRSGSTFFGELLSSLPASFYYFEPLMMYGQTDLTRPDLQARTVHIAHDLLKCHISRWADYIELTRNKSYVLEMMNGGVRRACQADSDRNGSLCHDGRFLDEACRMHPIHVMKTVRLTMRSAQELLASEDLADLQVIFLVRDPRATVTSRMKTDWCIEPTCSR